MRLLLILFFIGVTLSSAPPSVKGKAKAPVVQPISVPVSPTPKEQVAILRRITTQALDDIAQRLTTDDIAKLAPYREDPDTTRELLQSILQDRVANLPIIYARDREDFGPELFDMKIKIKAALLKRAIQRLDNWKPSWTSEQIEKMFINKTSNIAASAP